MKKIITTFYIDKKPLRYYVEISEDKSSFIFTPCLSNKENESFIIYQESGELKVKGKIRKVLLTLAMEEIASILSINLVEKINIQIRNSFLA
jgi:hypothetical protein